MLFQNIAITKAQLDESGLVTAIALANALKALYNSHLGDITDHTGGADAANLIAAADATDLATLIVLITEMLTDYDAHEGDAESGGALSYHAAEEVSDHSLISTAAPTTLNHCITDLNDFLRKFNSHDADATAHGVGAQYASTANYLTGFEIDIIDKTIGSSTQKKEYAPKEFRLVNGSGLLIEFALWTTAEYDKYLEDDTFCTFISVADGITETLKENLMQRDEVRKVVIRGTGVHTTGSEIILIQA